MNDRGNSRSLDQTSARFLGKADTAISSQEHDGGDNLLWGEENGRTPGVLGQTDVRIGSNESEHAGLAYDFASQPTGAAVGEMAGKAGELLADLPGNEWDMETNGLVRSGVRMEVQENDWLVAGSEASCSTGGNAGCLDIPSVIMADTWSAGSDGQAAERVRTLVPVSALDKVGEIASQVGQIPLFKELKGLDDAFGHVEMGALPEYARDPK